MTKKQENASIQLFQETLQSEGKSENTIRNYIADLKHIVNYTTPQQGGSPFYIEKKALEKYMRHFQNSGLSKTTINRRLYAIRTYYRIMKQLGHIDEDPTKGIRQLSVARQNNTHWLETHQVRQLFEAIDARQNMPEAYPYRMRAILSILVNCGLRVQELCDIKMEHIDWNNGVLKVVGKGEKFRHVPFNSATKKAMLRWLQYRSTDGEYLIHTKRSDHMTPRAVQHALKVLQDGLNFTFETHHLRHTALKRIADTTGRIETVASIAGHDNVETSRKYIEPSLREISEAMQKTEYDF